MLEVASRAEAIEWAMRAPLEDHELIEVREVDQAERSVEALPPALPPPRHHTEEVFRDYLMHPGG